jgi:orotidine-5'-phosphate decarboxylase
MKEVENKVILPLDGVDYRQACRLIDELHNEIGIFKVGFEMISRGYAGQICEYANSIGKSVFWDGKFHDIPATVAKASGIIANLPGVRMFNFHCLGGESMIAEAVKAAQEASAIRKERVMVLGVTILTSMTYANARRVGLFQQYEEFVYLNFPSDRESTEEDTLHAELVLERIEELVADLALMAKDSGADGVICSPQEIRVVRQTCGDDFVIVTPAVRPAGADHNDQARVMTPTQAIQLGANYLVIGRPILQPGSGTPLDAAKRINDEIAQALTA